MSLKSLTFCPSPSRRDENPIIAKRQRLIQRLEDQRRLIENPDYSVPHKKVVKNPDGTKAVVETQKRVKAWWKFDQKGDAILTVRNGFKPIEFEKGKAGIVVGTIDKMDGVLTTLISAVEAGELDQFIVTKKFAAKTK